MTSKFRGLGDIEGGDVVGLGTTPGLSTPARRPQAASQSRNPAQPPSRRPQGRQKATSARPDTSQPTSPNPARELLAPVEKEDAAPQKQRPGRPTKPRDDVDGTRPTNITVPVKLFKKIAQARESKGVSTGELIAIAIETHIDQLPALLAASNRPPATPGGMFSTRASRLPRRGDEPERPITYRMTSQDLAVIDGLVESLGARSRGHLITTALRAELDSKDD